MSFDRGEWEARTAERNAAAWDDYAASMAVQPVGAADELPYECPECGAMHDGATTGTEWCPDCDRRMNA